MRRTIDLPQTTAKIFGFGTGGQQLYHQKWADAFLPDDVAPAQIVLLLSCRNAQHHTRVLRNGAAPLIVTSLARFQAGGYGADKGKGSNRHKPNHG